MPDTPVLVFAKDTRRAVIVAGRNPIGFELRCLIDGELTWSRTCRTGDELRAEVTALEADFPARGWARVTP